MKSLKTILYIIITVFLAGSCREDTVVREKESVILDTDMGSDCDDVGALALLNQYQKMHKAEILSVIYSSGKVPYGVGIIDAINRYYGHFDIPVGASYDSSFGDPVDKMQAEKLAKDTAAFHNIHISNRDVPEQTVLNRRMLSARPDHSVTYITIGHTKGLYDLLVSIPDTISDLTGEQLVEKKIKRWVALGALGSNNEEGYYTKDWNFFFNGTAKYTKYLVEHFPKPVFFVDGGLKVLTGKSLIHTSAGNIVRTAYRDWLWKVEQKTLADQRPSWDLVTVYFAVEGAGEYFDILQNGYLDFDEEKGCRWIITDSISNHHFVQQKKDTDNAFAGYLNEMIVKKD